MESLNHVLFQNSSKKVCKINPLDRKSTDETKACWKKTRGCYIKQKGAALLCFGLVRLLPDFSHCFVKPQDPNFSLQIKIAEAIWFQNGNLNSSVCDDFTLFFKRKMLGKKLKQSSSERSAKWQHETKILIRLNFSKYNYKKAEFCQGRQHLRTADCTRWFGTPSQTHSPHWTVARSLYIQNFSLTELLFPLYPFSSASQPQ